MTESPTKKRRPRTVSIARLSIGNLEEVFEKFLWTTRFLVLFAVFAGLLAALLLFFLGTFDIIRVFLIFVRYAFGSTENVDIHIAVVSAVVGSVDIFLVAIILLIFSFGLYGLFINPLKSPTSEKNLTVLNIGSLEVLKDKIAHLIVLVLIVKFLQIALTMKVEAWLDALILAGSVVLFSTALLLIHWGKKLGGS